MNPITFREMGKVEGLFEPDESALAAASPRDCPERGAGTVSAHGVMTALCSLITREVGRSVGVDERTCRICICHGPADPLANSALQKHIVQCAFSGTVAGVEADAALEPSRSQLDIALENVRRWRGDEIARRFVDSLVYHQSVTPEEAVTLLEAHEISEAGE